MNFDRYSPYPFDGGEDIGERVRESETPQAMPCARCASARMEGGCAFGDTCIEKDGAIPFSKMNGFPIAMVYAPNAPFEDLYESPSEALQAGTLFRALDLPLETAMKGGRR